MSYVDWILPLNVKNIFKIFLKKQISKKHQFEIDETQDPLLKINEDLNNSEVSNKTCYILACGPSISEMDLSKIIGQDCISVSNFFVHPLYKDLKPKYHVFAPTHEPITEEQYNSWISDFHEKTQFSIKVFLNLLDKSMTDKVEYSSKIYRYYYKLSDIMPEFFDDISLTRPLPKIQTVVHIALYIAISLGYKEIRLLGVDHDWLLHFGESRHFYLENESKLVTKGYNEFTKELDLEKEFESHYILWSIYKQIKNKYINEIEIINLSNKSLLDVFDKKKY
jgi:hypothetical protein